MLEMLFKLKDKLVSIIFQTGRFTTVYKPKYKNNCLPIMKVVIKTLSCSSRNSEDCDKNFFILFFKEKQCTLSKQNKLKAQHYLGPSVEDTTFYISFIPYSAIGQPSCYRAVALKFLLFLHGEPDLVAATL